MKLCTRIFVLFSVLALTAGPVLADELVSLKAGYLMLSPEGTFAGTDKGFGTDIDLEGDLDFDDSQGATAEAALQLGNFRLAAGYLPLEFSGSGILTSSFDFNGQTFEVSDSVESDIDVDLYDVGLTYYLLNFDDLPVRLQVGLELAAKVVDGDITVRNETTGLTESIDGTAGLPTVGGRVRLALADFLGLVGRVGYSEYEDNSFLDADGQIEFSPLPFVGLYGGYRYMDLDVDESGILLDAEFAGPYGGAFVRF